MSDARRDVLRRIRSALHDVPAGETPSDILVPRTYRRTGNEERAAVVDRFAERVVEYRAAVHQVDEAGLPAALERACRRRGVRSLVVPPDLPDGWLPPGVSCVPDRDLLPQEIDSFDGVLTGCALGIAQTGTIVLDGGAGQGRRIITLLPDYHLCLVHADQVVDLVPEAMRRLAPAAEEGRPITFISGPSATSDIELNRVEGVHGPRTLEIVIVH